MLWLWKLHAKVTLPSTWLGVGGGTRGPYFRLTFSESARCTWEKMGEKEQAQKVGSYDSGGCKSIYEKDNYSTVFI